ncbi:hypothetical protein [Clostridium beijerinckii]|uniref:hypothetical protein n=1 Tax=Clostridium beijerinckii TaxID=1520 RepID=UPI0015C2D037|nr:hypothetical protein [Clostridium beijerinckii]
MYSRLERMNTLLCSVSSENIAVGISLAEVVPVACHELPSGACNSGCNFCY